MKLGLGLYRHMLTSENYRFARQAGATHIVAHLVDYFRGAPDRSHDDQPTGSAEGWGRAGDPNQLWTVEELRALKDEINVAGLELEAIENFDPAHWHDILLDGPRRHRQLEDIKTIIRRVGEAGIPIIGYNFSIAGVCGRVTGPFARGDALSVGMQGTLDTPMPRGMVWNMVYDSSAPPGEERSASPEELWDRLDRFLNAVVPVAEEAGVVLAAHPDDPPVPTLRGQPRLVYQPQLFERLVNSVDSTSNALEYCVGTVAEMPEGDVYQATDEYSRQRKLAYVHLRNVAGKAPHYHETFVDDGDVDIMRVLQILKRNGFDGVIVPDHTPQMTCGAAWHAGMAFALGYLRACLNHLNA